METLTKPVYEPYDADLPRDEASARRSQRAAEVLYRRVLAWASRVLAILPQRLPLTPADLELLRLFLAQQRRLNLELDGRNGHHSPLAFIAKVLPFLQRGDEEHIARAAHKLASSYLEHAIEDAAERFCGQHRLSPSDDIVINWRVALRYMAQQIHRLASSINLREEPYLNAPRRYELALIVYELAAEVVERRNLLLEATDTTVSA